MTWFQLLPHAAQSVVAIAPAIVGEFAALLDSVNFYVCKPISHAARCPSALMIVVFCRRREWSSSSLLPALRVKLSSFAVTIVVLSLATLMSLACSMCLASLASMTMPSSASAARRLERSSLPSSTPLPVSDKLDLD